MTWLDSLWGKNIHSIDIWSINTHEGEKCSSGAHISWGGFSLLFFMHVLPKLLICKITLNL